MNGYCKFSISPFIPIHDCSLSPPSFCCCSSFLLLFTELWQCCNSWVSTHKFIPWLGLWRLCQILAFFPSFHSLPTTIDILVTFNFRSSSSSWLSCFSPCPLCADIGNGTSFFCNQVRTNWFQYDEDGMCVCMYGISLSFLSIVAVYAYSSSFTFFCSFACLFVVCLFVCLTLFRIVTIRIGWLIRLSVIQSNELFYLSSTTWKDTLIEWIVHSHSHRLFAIESNRSESNRINSNSNSPPMHLFLQLAPSPFVRVQTSNQERINVQFDQHNFLYQVTVDDNSHTSTTCELQFGTTINGMEWNGMCMAHKRTALHLVRSKVNVGLPLPMSFVRSTCNRHRELCPSSLLFSSLLFPLVD